MRFLERGVVKGGCCEGNSESIYLSKKYSTFSQGLQFLALVPPSFAGLVLAFAPSKAETSPWNCRRSREGQLECQTCLGGSNTRNEDLVFICSSHVFWASVGQSLSFITAA